MPEYTVLTVVSVVAVVALELLWLRTGLFRRAQYWIAMAIIFSFQTLVDGWLTKLSDPIVQYAPEQMLGIRAPWDIPIEDFGFGFSMVTLTLLLWVRLNRRAEARRSGTAPTDQRPNDQPRPEMTRPEMTRPEMTRPDATRVDER